RSCVMMGKVSSRAPAGTVTSRGIVATDGLELESENTTPPAGAGPPRVIVPVMPPPSSAPVGFTERPARNGAKTVRDAAPLLSPAAAEIREVTLIGVG